MLTIYDKFKHFWLFIVKSFCCTIFKIIVTTSNNFLISLLNKLKTKSRFKSIIFFNKILVLFLLLGFVFNQIFTTIHQANHHHSSSSIDKYQDSKINFNSDLNSVSQQIFEHNKLDQDLLNCLLCSFNNLIKKFIFSNQSLVYCQLLIILKLIFDSSILFELRLYQRSIRAPPQLS